MQDLEHEQQAYFEIAEHQYALDAIREPPLHTVIEQERLVDALGTHGNGRRVVDFGAGTGRLTVALLRHGYNVHAVDLSASSLGHLRDVVQALDLPPVTTSTALPETGSFDAVVGADILHHVDMSVYLPKVRAILGQQGKVVFTEPGGLNPLWYVYLSIFYSMKIERRIVFSTPWSLRRAFERSGFRNVKVTGVGVLPRPIFGRNERLCRWHDRMGNAPVLRWFAYRYLVEADA